MQRPPRLSKEIFLKHGTEKDWEAIFPGQDEVSWDIAFQSNMGEDYFCLFAKQGYITDLEVRQYLNDRVKPQFKQMFVAPQSGWMKSQLWTAGAAQLTETLIPFIIHLVYSGDHITSRLYLEGASQMQPTALAPLAISAMNGDIFLWDEVMALALSIQGGANWVIVDDRIKEVGKRKRAQEYLVAWPNEGTWKHE